MAVHFGHQDVSYNQVGSMFVELSEASISLVLVTVLQPFSSSQAVNISRIDSWLSNTSAVSATICPPFSAFIDFPGQGVGEQHRRCANYEYG
tara:strand:- start:1008 stop:1283 length:276 start_codon:yes stop_codon:yes gene_type:complete